MQQGRQEGEQSALRALLQARFASPALADYEVFLEKADRPTLHQWIAKAAIAQTREEVFQSH